MESKTVIIILSIIVILLAVGLVVELFAFNNNSQPTNVLNNTTSQNTTVVSISNDSQQVDPIEANRPKNDPNYKGYTPLHESEITSDGWNPREHETYRENMPDGSQKIHYDDGYFRIVDKNGYVITYGYG